MDWFFVIYMAFGVLAIVLSYLGVRAIDYSFRKKDRKYDQLNEIEMSEIRYQHAKGGVQSFTNGQKAMAKEMVKSINDSLLTMAKQFEDL